MTDPRGLTTRAAQRWNKRLLPQAAGLQPPHDASAATEPAMASRKPRYTRISGQSGAVHFVMLEYDLLDESRFRNQTETKMAVFGLIEGRCSPRRLRGVKMAGRRGGTRRNHARGRVNSNPGSVYVFETWVAGKQRTATAGR